MKNGKTILIVTLSALAVGGLLYFSVFKKSNKKMKEEIAAMMLEGGDTDANKKKLLETLDKLTVQEIKDVYTVAKIFKETGKLTISDTALKGRFQAISLKYGIFA
jgi:hypothetical protein